MPGANQNSDSFKSALFIFVAGAVGGFCYWVLQRSSGLLPFGWRFYAAIPALLLFGGIAALFGVYILANSSTSREAIPRTLVFALLCGFSWRVVIDAAKATLSNSSVARKADAAQNKAEDLQQSIKSGNASNVEQKIDDTVKTTAQAVKDLPAVQNDQVKEKVQTASEASVNTLVEASKVNPEVSVSGLETLGREAARTNNERLTNYVLKSLDAVAANNPEAQAKARAAKQSVISISAR